MVSQGMNPHQYIFTETADGSPSLRWESGELQERMHHSSGAYTETQYIYGWAIRKAFEANARAFVSVGLGMGYNELLIAAEALKYGLLPGQVHLLSFESSEILRAQFLAFLAEDSDYPKYYDLLLIPFEKDYPQVSSIKSWLLDSLRLGAWDLQAELDAKTEFKVKAQCILYDVFSSKTTPLLWAEEFLQSFVRKAIHQELCVFATYACTGALLRTLKAHGFVIQKIAGFPGKRENTHAVLGVSL